MVTVSKAVKDILRKQVFLQEAINRDIVSYNSLAKHLRPEVEEEVGKTVKHSAVVMALRRYAEKLEKKKEQISFNYFRETLLKSDICYIAFEESSTTLNKVQELYNEIDIKRGGIFNIIQGNYETGVITNARYKKRFLELLGDEKIINIVDDLVVISLTYSKDFLFTPGVMYNVLRFLAWENINVINLTMTSKELNLVIQRDQAMQCYNILERLVKPYKSQKEE
jgi:hypothetical protein